MKKTLKGKLKGFFIIFKGLSVAKNCRRPESAPEKAWQTLKVYKFMR